MDVRMFDIVATISASEQNYVALGKTDILRWDRTLSDFYHKDVFNGKIIQGDVYV